MPVVFHLRSFGKIKTYALKDPNDLLPDSRQGMAGAQRIGDSGEAEIDIQGRAAGTGRQLFLGEVEFCLRLLFEFIQLLV
jgi:hypothetical protein